MAQMMRARSTPLRLHVYQSQYGAVNTETQQAMMKLLRTVPAAGTASQPGTASVGRRVGSKNENVEWTHVSDMHISTVLQALDELPFDVCRYIPEYVHPAARHGEHLRVPCVVLPSSHQKYVQNICIWRQQWRCNGACGCVPYLSRPCRVLVKLESYAQTPTQVSMFRNTLASPCLEAHEHCGPSNAASYHVPERRRLPRTTKLEISESVRKKQTAAQYLSEKRGQAMWAHTASQSGVPLTSQALRQVDFSNTRTHPNQQQISAHFRRATTRLRLHKNDAEAVTNIARNLSGLPGFFVFHQQGTSDRPELLVITREELALQAIKSHHVVGWDAGHGLNAYGYKHWEHVSVQEVDGSLKGIPTAFCSSSDGSTVTQTVLLVHLYAYFKKVARKAGMTFIAPSGVVIDKDRTSNQAWRRVFPNICIIYCLYHLNTWLNPVLRTKANGVPDKDHQKIRNQIYKMMSAQTEQAFENLLDRYTTEWGVKYPVFLSVFEAALVDDPAWKDTWVEFTRQHLPHALLAVCRTNMLTEAAIRWTKYVSFDGRHNKRMDLYIMELINKSAYFLVESAQRTSGLLSVKPKQKKAKDNAVLDGERLFADGCVSPSPGETGVHIVRHESVHYIVRRVALGSSSVNLYACSCPSYTRRREQCSHIVAVKKYCGHWHAVAVDSLAGRPAQIVPRARAPDNHTYKRFRADMKAVQIPGRRSGRASKRSLSAREREDRLHAEQRQG
jgi:hypothetical protein